MNIIGKRKLEAFWSVHKKARKPLERWLKVAQYGQWKSFSDAKKTFGSADWYSKHNRDYVIFNVGGNNYRLITAINFKGLLIVIEIVMTHDEYDKNKWKEKL